MKLATFTVEGRDADRVGVVDSEAGVLKDITDALGVQGLLDVITTWSARRIELTAVLAALPTIPLEEVILGAPIPTLVRNVFCVGKNYSDHVREFGRSGYDTPSRSEELPARPIVFSKVPSSVTGPYDDIESHPGLTDELDYEGELGVIIGTGGRGISRDEAYDHVWGYTIINDVTARDLQRDHKQWLLGKSLDTHCPMGPYAVSSDEIGDVSTLEIETLVNGERRQFAPVKDLIFDIPELIATISAGITLVPGDVIATGTPAGVGIGFDPPRFLRSGDVVEVRITGLGAQRNTIA